MEQKQGTQDDGQNNSKEKKLPGETDKGVGEDQGKGKKPGEPGPGKDEGEDRNGGKKKRNKKKSKGKKKKSKRKSHKKRKEVKRNMTVYPGVNFLHSKKQGFVQLYKDYEVYVKESEHTELLKSQTATRFVRGLVDKVYTKEAILGSTPQGYPPRGKGKTFYANNMQPRLHPDGLNAIIAAVKDLEETNKTWRPRASDKNLKSAFAVRCCELKQQWSQPSSSESESSSDESASDSSCSSSSSGSSASGKSSSS